MMSKYKTEIGIDYRPTGSNMVKTIDKKSK